MLLGCKYNSYYPDLQAEAASENGEARNHATFVHKQRIRRLDRIDAT
jgi:hypothetical protein